jgi:putative ABC transport system permease protein
MTPLRYLPVRNNMLPYTAVGTDFASIAKTSPYWRVTGSWPATDTEVLVGTDIAEYARLSPGATLVLDGRNSGQEKFEAEMRVTGVVATGGVEDGFIFMRLSAMEAMTGERGMADVVEISCNAGEKELLRISGEIRADIPALDPRLVKRVTRSEATVLGKLEMLVWLVTLIVLVLSMICVGTTMMTMVMERSREIGLKKALGAGNRRIAGEFLAEGVLLGLAGGLGGGLCGLLFAQLVSAGVFGRSVTVALGLLPATVAASVLVTVVACLLPARRAMDIEPALVLRGE